MECQIEIKIVETPIDIHAIDAFTRHPNCGGVSLFIGNVRNVTAGKPVQHLEFEAYTSMAVKELQKIADFIVMAWSPKRIIIHHRIGILDIGETAVAIGVACPHRKNAIAACSYAIDTLKQTVPIWKKEVFDDGEVWVAAHP